MCHLFRRLALLFLGSSWLYLVGTGCRSYPAAPLDWSREASDWSVTATNPVTLTLTGARQLALVLNPEINAFRLSRLSSERRALAAGWWDDPELDLDALRMLQGGPHPWILGGGLKFTLPLNGVPGSERQAALAYARADALAVAAAEQRLLAEVDSLWNACQTDRRCAALQNAYMERLEGLEQQVGLWVAAGELSRDEGDRIARERVALELECACCGAETVARQQALLRLLGLHPAASVALEDEDGALDATPPSGLAVENMMFGVPPEADIDLVRHAGVREKVARLDAGEEELRAEIRKQYPDLRIGPRVEHEDGGARLGVSLGLALPLWNRNRKGIADAEGGRDAARLEAVNVWRGLVAEWHEARRLLQTAEVKERRIREELLPGAKDAVARTERLFGHGEADVAAVAAAERTLYEVRESLLEAQKDLVEVRIRLSRLHVPRDSEKQE